MSSRAALASLLLVLVPGGPMRSEPPPLRFGGKPPAPVLNIAHRGARAFAPENTLEAIDKAVPFGCHMVEIDIHMSKDGELIVVHDDDLVRCSDVKTVFPDRSSYFVSDFTAAEIRRLDAGSWYIAELDKPAQKRQPVLRSLTDDEIKAHIQGTDRAHYASGKVRHPTLRECLERCRKLGLLLNIEIKSIPRLYPDIADKVVKLVEELKMDEAVIVSSFDHEQLAAVRKANKRIATGVVAGDRLHQPGRYARELLDADAWNPGCYGPVDTLGFGSVTGTLDRTGIAEARKAGIGVNVWTENDPKRMRQLIEAGATGIFTDYPNRLQEVLRGRDKRP
jgi:glycerophosphoryl diester phosphodiesterase